MKNVISYQRVSTGTQTHSLEKQRELISNYCSKNDFQVIQSFQDVCSDNLFLRPEFNKLLQFCMSESEKVDLIVISDWDRFGRDGNEVKQMISSLSELGIEVKSINQ